MANVILTIPRAMAGLSGGQTVFRLGAGCVLDAIRELDRLHPGLKERFLDDQDRLRDYINAYVNSEEIDTPEELRAPLKDGDKLTLVPALAGG